MSTPQRKPLCQRRLGQMLYEYRAFRRLTLRDVAAEIGISAPTLMRIEQGQSFDADTLLKMWNWLLAEDRSDV